MTQGDEVKRRRSISAPFTINAWPSFSDALASGLLILVFIITMLSVMTGKVLEEMEQKMRATRIEEEVVRAFQQTIEEQGMSVEREATVLRINLPESLLFDSGSAEIKPGGEPILREVGVHLEDFGYSRVEVDGHTDDQPIRTTLQTRYETNWELSTARSSKVVRFLVEEAGLRPETMTASGRSEFDPIDTNDTEEGRARNRRIEIVVYP